MNYLSLPRATGKICKKKTTFLMAFFYFLLFVLLNIKQESHYCSIHLSSHSVLFFIYIEILFPCFSFSKKLLYHCTAFTSLHSTVCNWLKSGEIVASWSRLCSKSFASINYTIRISLFLTTIENIKNLQYKKFLQL